MSLMVAQILGFVVILFILYRFLFRKKKAGTAAKASKSVYEQFAAKIKKDPTSSDSWLGWGAAICDLAAQAKSDDEKTAFWNDANEKFTKALAHSEHKVYTLKIWGFALARASVSFKPPLQMQYLQFASGKMVQALGMDPANESLPFEWGEVLLEIEGGFSGAERMMILQEACTQFSLARKNGFKDGKLMQAWSRALLQLARLSAEGERKAFLLEAYTLYKENEAIFRNENELSGLITQIEAALGISSHGTRPESKEEVEGLLRNAPGTDPALALRGIKCANFAEEEVIDIDEIVRLHEQAQSRSKDG